MVVASGKGAGPYPEEPFIFEEVQFIVFSFMVFLLIFKGSYIREIHLISVRCVGSTFQIFILVYSCELLEEGVATGTDLFPAHAWHVFPNPPRWCQSFP